MLTIELETRLPAEPDNRRFPRQKKRRRRREKGDDEMGPRLRQVTFQHASANKRALLRSTYLNHVLNAGVVRDVQIHLLIAGQAVLYGAASCGYC